MGNSTTNHRLQLTQEVITPAMARELLKKNDCNRPLRQTRAAHYARQISRGEWKLNGETIVFADDGTCVQGQHRLTAIILADIAIETVVVRGVNKSVFDSLDQGAKRTAGDVLSIRGETNYNVLSAAATQYHRWLVTGNPYHGGPAHQPSIQQIEKYVSDRPELRKSVSWASKAKWCRRFMTPSFTAFSRFIFSDTKEELAVDFFDQLETGSGLYDLSPLLALRERLMLSAASKEKITPVYRAALTFKAFRLFADGASIKYLRVRTEGEAVEKGLFTLP